MNCHNKYIFSHELIFHQHQNSSTDKFSHRENITEAHQTIMNTRNISNGSQGVSFNNIENIPDLHGSENMQLNVAQDDASIPISEAIIEKINLFRCVN